MKEIRGLIPSIYNKFIKLHKAEKNCMLIPEITVNEEYYLEIIYSLGSPTFTEFAEKAEITKPAATQIVKKLIDKGYVEKTQCGKDKRVYYIKTNDIVKKHFQESDMYLDQIYKNCLSRLSEDEKDQLKMILCKIDDSLCQTSKKS